ncbi:ABC transporter ATP-binding protein [Maritimibacter alexandrii]|uniref:ABC transporter ATP-binding protein n=1 Tax=Maritimibacter alexandrii TaxID=2570355 RepID=UPI001108A257|nr:ABC transporter ATP-binding protein [Maritimibacter alexandrii]
MTTTPDEERSSAEANVRLGTVAIGLWCIFSRRERLRLVGLFGAMLLLAVVELATLYGIQVYMSLISSRAPDLPGTIGPWVTTMDLRTRLVVFSAALMLLFALKLAIGIGTYALLARAVSLQTVAFSNRLFQAYQYAPYLWHLGRHTSELQRNLTADTSQISNGVVLQLLQLALNLVMALSVLGFIVLALPPILVGMICALAAALFVAGKGANRQLQSAGREARNATGDMIKAVQEGLGALTEARLMGTRHGFIRAFAQKSRDFGAANRKTIFAMQIAPVLLETLMLVALVLIIGFIVLTADSIEAAFGQATVLAVAIFRLRQTLTKVANSTNRISSFSAAFPPLAADLKELEDHRAQEDAGVSLIEAPTDGFAELSFENAGFTFPGTDAAALSDINVSLKRGEHVAIMGPTGAGKSTFLVMLLGLIQPTSGQVKLDGADLASVLAIWNGQIGYVPQTVFLTDDTIAANVALGLPEVKHDPERLRMALDSAQLTDFIATLPDGINTRVGERGGNLSGGQRQRVGIARALYHEPSVVVLDEATSALDRATQSKVMNAIATLPQNPTVISVTHHLDTLTHAERVILFAGGRVSVDASVDDAMRNEEFRRVTQAKDFEGAA